MSRCELIVVGGEKEEMCFGRGGIDSFFGLLLPYRALGRRVQAG